jgi:hypothetical protein
MSVLARVLRSSVVMLTRIACVCALIGLGLMAYSLIDPRAIPVIVAMSVGHAFGFAAFGCYLLAVVLDTQRSRAALKKTSGAESAPEVPVDSST